MSSPTRSDPSVQPPQEQHFLLNWKVNSPSSPSVRKTIKTLSFSQPKSTPGQPDTTATSKESDGATYGESTRYEWVKGVVICALGSSTVAFINIVLAIAAIALSYGKNAALSDTGSGILYEGDCERVRGWTTGLHLVINILSTLLLGASNYCMQCLSAPSREDVDRAHAQRKWLDIGTPGLRNLRFINKRRKTLWFILLITSVPVHLFYNSVVFNSLVAYEYPVYVAPSDSDLQTTPIDTLGDAHSNECFASFAGQSISDVGLDFVENPKFERLSKEECINGYAVDFVTNRKSVVVLASNITSDAATLLSGATGNGAADSALTSRYAWMCSAAPRYGTNRNWCTRNIIMDNFETWSVLAGGWTGTPSFTLYATHTDGSQMTFGAWNITSFDGPSTSEELKQDLETLANFLQDAPVYEEDLIRFLDDATNWKDSSWAANVRYDVSPSCGYTTGGGGNLSWERDTSYKVDGCYSEQADEKCKLLFSWPMCLVVVVCNLIKVFCMFLTAKEDRSEIFLTIGDAIASFLRHPDKTTTSRCLTAKSTLSNGPNPWQPPLSKKARIARALRRIWNGYIRPVVMKRSNHEFSAPKHIPLPMTEGGSPAKLMGQQRWFHITGLSRYIWTVSFVGAGVGVAMVFFIISVETLQMDNADSSFEGLWRLGFGAISSRTLIRSPASGDSIFYSVVIMANLPQLCLSFVYFTYNSLLTTMVLSIEYTSYGSHRKPLRVSWPKGAQRSTYYLTLPYAYNVPLLSTFAILHWLLSQSIFYVNIYVEPFYHPYLNSQRTLQTCGYSPIPLMFTIIVSGLMTLALIALGLRRYDSFVPLASNCSAAISAACHPPADDKNAGLKPIMWGEVIANHGREESSNLMSVAENLEDEMDGRFRGGYAHCSFTSKDVVTPSATKLYA